MCERWRHAGCAASMGQGDWAQPTTLGDKPPRSVNNCFAPLRRAIVCGYGRSERERTSGAERYIYRTGKTRRSETLGLTRYYPQTNRSWNSDLIITEHNIGIWGPIAPSVAPQPSQHITGCQLGCQRARVHQGPTLTLYRPALTHTGLQTRHLVEWL